jgi:hypothetical protein
MAQKPRTFRAERCVHILGILKFVHEETYNGLVALIREQKCALADADLRGAAKRFEDSVVWEMQGKSKTGYFLGRGTKPDRPTSTTSAYS